MERHGNRIDTFDGFDKFDKLTPKGERRGGGKINTYKPCSRGTV